MKEKVLILIVMDGVLGESTLKRKGSCLAVLILIVMDGVLGVEEKRKLFGKTVS